MIAGPRALPRRGPSRSPERRGGCGRPRLVGALALAVALGLAGCGGSDAPATGLTPSSELAARCASPRTGVDPATGRDYPDRQGTSQDEKSWIRSWETELYLWYRELPDPDPAAYASPASYFLDLKTDAVTGSGKAKDQFHFVYATSAWESLSQSGVSAGYGAQWAILAKRPPREILVATVEPSSPAARAGIARGAEVLAVDGVDAVNGADAATINAGLGPAGAGESHTFTILDRGAATPRTITLVSEDVTSSPVPTVATLAAGGSDAVGYVLFDDHVATAEAALVAAVQQLRAAAVTDLVLDIRYNGGGFLDVASELAFMIAGPGRTRGRTFERPVFNDRYPTTNPVTGDAIAPVPFHDATVGLSLPAGQALPSLGLGRVFVLTGPDTCSASESIVNGLRGVGVEVIQVGEATCGKPYGFYPQDNCGTTYFAIEFQGVNDQGFGDYPDGFAPGGTGPASPPGCVVADDFGHDLGDPAEARLAAALGYRASGACPPAAQALTAGEPAATSGARVPKAPWLQNRIYRR